MESTIQNVLEQNEEVKWEGKQDLTTAIVVSLVSVIFLVIAGLFFYFTGSGSEGTCTVNGVVRPMAECNSLALKVSYVFFVLAILAPMFSYWRYRVTYYLVTNKRLMIKSGFIGADINSIYYDRVHSVLVNVGVIGKIFSTGNVLIDTGKSTVTHNKDNHSTQIVYDRFVGIKNPYDVYKIVQEILNQNKKDLYGGKGIAR